MQVGLPESDQRSLQFLWQKNPASDVSKNQDTRHLFGAKHSSTCANYALNRTAVDNQDRYPEAAYAVLNKFYMYDYLGSVKISRNCFNVESHFSMFSVSNGTTSPIRWF